MGSDEKAFDVGILFIHGIGTQIRGETLAQCGGPLFRWMEDRCAALDRRWERAGATAQDVDGWRQRVEAVQWGSSDTSSHCPPDLAARGVEAGCHALLRRVELEDTRFLDPTDLAAPARASLKLIAVELDGRLSSERWLLAESWWADTFSPPTFSELAHWSLGIVPWIIGSHFAAQINRRLGEKPDTTAALADRVRRIWELNRWLWRVAAAFGGFGLGLASGILALPALALMLALGTIPIPRLRSALLRVQLRLAATLGDSYVLLARPIEAASIVGKVRRDLRWLTARCNDVVIVAHSQGGALAHLALRGAIPAEIRLLFTFGSGLRKLEELRELMKTGASFAFSAFVTLVALGMFLLSSGALAIVVVTGAPASPASLLITGLVAFGSLAVCITGIRDHLRGIELGQLARWIRWLQSSGLRWTDCYATADPVPNGIVAPAARALSREVSNYASMLWDHTTYWSNRDQFVSVLYGAMARARTRDPNPDLQVSDATLDRIGKRRRWRVGIGRAIQWAGVGGVLVAIAHAGRAWEDVGSMGWTLGRQWLAGLLGRQAPADTTLSAVWPALGFLALVLLPYWITRKAWTSWNESEMQTALRLDTDRWSSPGVVMTFFSLFLIIVVGLAMGRVPPFPVFFALLTGPALIITILEPREPRQAGQQKDLESRTSAVEGLLSLVIAIALAAALPFSIGLSLWEGVVWVTARLLGGSVFGFRPDTISSYLVGGVATLLFLVGLAFHTLSGGADRRQGNVRPR
jgi:hypothetical protein